MPIFHISRTQKDMLSSPTHVSKYPRHGILFSTSGVDLNSTLFGVFFEKKLTSAVDPPRKRFLKTIEDVLVFQLF